MTTAKRSLADLAAQFEKKGKSEGATNASWKKFFPFWKAETDTTSIVRFLPDADTNNPMSFLVENRTHTLIINGKRETVPCLEMFGEKCPICAKAQHYYDEKSPDHDKTLGKKYYRKLSYIGQVLVYETPIELEGDDLIRLIEFGPAVFKQIQAAFKSGDLEETPESLKGGYNFRIRKTQSGEYASYSTSGFAPKQTDVSDDLIEAITPVMYNLADFRTAKISREAMLQMLEADEAGTSYEAPGSDAGDAAPAERAEKPKAQESAAPSDDGGGKKLSMVELLQRRAAAAAKAAQGDE